jgi:uncharacterized protein (TIGR01777 family)
MKILLTGGTGLIGRELGKKLVNQGHEVILISRSIQKAKMAVAFPASVIEGDLERGSIQSPLLSEIDAVVHLMGETVSEFPWSAEKKKRILDSRVHGTRNLIQSLKAAHAPLKRVISASAIGYYGDRGDELLIDSSTPGDSFLASVCKQWEAEGQGFERDFPGLFLAFARIGIVLSEKGGAFEKLRLPFWYGVGHALGSGRQWMSWIHLDDVVNYLSWLLFEAKISGAYNLVSPEPATNLELSRELAQQLKALMAPKVPAVLLKTLLGEFSAILLASQKCTPQKALDQGFKFKYTKLSQALHELCHFYQNGQAYFEQEQFFNVPVNELFPFFAEAANLEKITPPFLNFKITKISSPQIEKGTLIDYRLKIHGVPVGWRTLIETWQPPVKFVDTQLKGPYRLWHHTHAFEPLAGGTLMRDEIRFKVPLGRLGYALAGWWVRGDISKIFTYRKKVCEEIFHH